MNGHRAMPPKPGGVGSGLGAEMERARRASLAPSPRRGAIRRRAREIDPRRGPLITALADGTSATSGPRPQWRQNAGHSFSRPREVLLALAAPRVATASGPRRNPEQADERFRRTSAVCSRTSITVLVFFLDLHPTSLRRGAETKSPSAALLLFALRHCGLYLARTPHSSRARAALHLDLFEQPAPDHAARKKSPPSSGEP